MHNGDELGSQMTAPAFRAIPEPRQRSFWIAVICGAVILTIGSGARQSFGIFQKPIAADLGVGRELWSFANALAMLLMGAFSPFAGNLADRFGTARAVAAGGVLYVVGMMMIAFATEGVMLTSGNVLCGIGMAAAGFGPIFGSVSRQTPPAKRNLTVDDYFRIKGVEDPHISPDGKWIAYAVETASLKDDKNHKQIWMISTAGGDAIPLTSEAVNSSHPRWSPDGKYLAFLSARSGGGFGNFIHLQPVNAALRREEQDVAVRRGDEEMLDEVLFARFGADAALAAA